MSNWYIYSEPDPQGPFTEEQIKQFILNGRLTNESYIIKEGDTEWSTVDSTEKFHPQKFAANAASNAAASENQSASGQPEKMTIKQFVQKHDFLDEEGLCPSCGYFAGSLLTCPRCGARTANKISLIIVKKIAIFGSIIGIILLWVASYMKQPQTVVIGDIDEKMNGALVRIEGRVTEYKEDAAKNTLKMKVDDGTGNIGINAFNKLAALKKMFGENMPKVGDRIEIIGSLNQTQKFGASMFLSVPERLKVLEEFELKEYKISELKKDHIGEMVKIKAYVQNYQKRATKSGTNLHIFTLSDNTGKLGMTIFDKQMESMPEDAKKVLLQKGALLEMPVTLSDYRGNLQATITDFEKVKRVGNADMRGGGGSSGGDDDDSESSDEDEKPKKTYTKKSSGGGYDSNAEANTFSNITKDDVGKSYKFSAEVVGTKKMGKNLMVNLIDSSKKRMSVMIFDNMKDKIDGFDNIDKGAKISGIFEIDEYKGKLQLKLKNTKSVKVD